MTRDNEAALTILYARLVQQQASRVAGAQVRAAERKVVATRFGGSRPAYVAALRRAGASPLVALGAIADELRLEPLLLRLRATAPSRSQIAEFAATYASVRLRDIPGAGTVEGVDPATPLGLLPDSLARPAIVRALRHASRVERYAGWAERRQERALDGIRCVRDRLPQVGSLPLTSWLPFLALPVGSSTTRR